MSDLDDLPEEVRQEILMKFNEHKSSGYLSMIERSSRYLGSAKQGSIPADNQIESFR
jgi:hypothetical protein